MPRSRAAPLMTTRLAAALVIACALSFIAVLVLTAYAPDLRSQTNGGNALSKSAIGFAGLRVLLSEAGVPTSIARRRDQADAAFVILTPDERTEAADLRALAAGRLCLIVLPKWEATGDPFHMGWVLRTGRLGSETPVRLLEPFSKSVAITEDLGERRTQLSPHNDLFAGLWPKSVPLDGSQLLRGKDWIGDVTSGDGGAVIAHLRGTNIYVLSDPDILSTHALRDPAVARAALGLIERLRGGMPVAFDVTLNGFGSPPSILRAAFSPPFLGATLCAILAAVLVGFHALSRFGAPVRPDAVYAFGKTLLVNNSAGLIRLLGREPAMAARYASASFRLVVRYVGGPRELSLDTLGAIERRAHSARHYVDLKEESERVRSSAAAVNVARELYQWRVGITHDNR